MASDETMPIHSSMHEDDQYEDEHHPHNLSRLSVCTSSSKLSVNDFEDDMMMFMSGLSIESSCGEGEEADEEFSEEDDHKGVNMYGASSDSDKDIHSSYLSLPETPLQIQQYDQLYANSKEYYSSENEAAGEKGMMGNKTKRNSRSKAMRERWLEREWEKKKYKAKTMDEESDQCLVIAKPNGGRRSMCMDLGEVKACRDLGFELENPRMLESPSQISCSTVDTTSSGGNSPIASWRISSPGDDPRDVKARLKVWAQAVATSASRLVG